MVFFGMGKGKVISLLASAESVRRCDKLETLLSISIMFFGSNVIRHQLPD